MTKELKELIAAAESLLAWQPHCSRGSSGDLRQTRLKAAIARVASVAQQAEHGFCKPEVGGSIPSAGSKCPIADEQTHGRFYCTRERGHAGSCAAVERLFGTHIREAMKVLKKIMGESVNGKPAGSKPATESSSLSSPAKEEILKSWSAIPAELPELLDHNRRCRSRFSDVVRAVGPLGLPGTSSEPAICQADGYASDCDCFAVGRHNCPVHK